MSCLFPDFRLWPLEPKGVSYRLRVPEENRAAWVRSELLKPRLRSNRSPGAGGGGVGLGVPHPSLADATSAQLQKLGQLLCVKRLALSAFVHANRSFRITRRENVREGPCHPFSGMHFL